MNIINKITNNKNHYTGVNPCNYITIHETGNKNSGANALNHSRFINNGSKSTWHYTVDSDRVVKHYDDKVQCWHCGDGRGKGNTQSIGIEMCINSDGDMMKTIQNTIELVKHLMNKHNIPLSNVFQHNNWSGKDCPRYIRQGKPITWNTFKSMITSNSNNVLYKVQVGAFSNKSNAINLQNDLKSKGYDTYLVKVNK